MSDITPLPAEAVMHPHDMYRKTDSVLPQHDLDNRLGRYEITDKGRSALTADILQQLLASGQWRAPIDAELLDGKTELVRIGR